MKGSGFSFLRVRFFPLESALFVLFFSFLILSVSARAVEKGDDLIRNGKFRLLTPREKARLVASEEQAASEGRGRGNLQTVIIPASYTGTGHSEEIEYQVPSGYDPQNPDGYPLMVCWHRYSQTCFSVAIRSQIDEECEERTWLYLSITGIFQENYGYPLSQVQCSKAIEYLMDDQQGLGLHVDTNRIYMAGCSMGGAAVASYAARHMSSEEGFRVAGIILVASPYDWTDAYNQGDPAVKYWLPYLLGGTPTEIPFAYKQISALYLENGNYVLNESMGQNLRHNTPVYFAYAGNDPLSYGPSQNEALVQMLQDIQANCMVNYTPVAQEPHDWPLLDVDEAFDFMQAYTLEDQETETIHILADRNAKFYWADVVQHAADQFSRIEGTADPSTNTLTVTDAVNLSSLTVDCDWAGLAPPDPLWIQYHSSSDWTETLALEPIPVPTYIVDRNTGVLYPDYSYVTGSQCLSITRNPSEDLDLKVSYEPYNLFLQCTDSVSVGGILSLHLEGGDPFDSYLVLFSFVQKETQAFKYHTLLVDPLPPTIWLIGTLDGTGMEDLNIHVPYDPNLQNQTVYEQGLSYISTLKEVSNLQSTFFY